MQVRSLLIMILIRIYFCNSILLAEIFDEPDLEKELAFLQQGDFQQLLIDRQHKRPDKCPLKSMAHSEIVKKLSSIAKSLKKGECFDKNKDTIKNIDETINMTNKNLSTLSSYQNNEQFGVAPVIMNSPELQKTNIEARQYQFAINPYYRQLLSSFSTLAQDDDCVNNIRERGLLPVLADVSMTMGQSFALLPTANGLMFSAGGMALGATLKIISGLIKSPYDWKDPQQRKQFQDLNCSFFDLRRDIEATELLDAPDEQLGENIKRLEKNDADP